MAAKHEIKFNLAKQSYELLLNIAKVAGVISLIYGVAFGVFQFYETKKEKRIEETLTLFRQFNTAPFTEYRKNINAAVLDNYSEISEAASDEKKLTAAVAGVVRKTKLQTDLAFVMNFFDSVVYCAAKNICDADVSYDLFYARARELYVPFFQYIQAQRTFAGNDFGAGVETLVNLKKDPTNK